MNNREAMQEAFEAFMANDEKFPDGCNMTERVFNAGYQAALASQAQQPAFPPRDLTKQAEQQGMFSKFHVERVDGSSAKGGKHHGCRYWVLDLDHDKHAPAAMRGYAEDCKETHPILSAEIFAEFGMQSQAQQESKPVARVAEVHMSRYTLEWIDAQVQPEGTLLYALPPAPEGGDK